MCADTPHELHEQHMQSQVQVLITVFDENPTGVTFGLVGPWREILPETEENKAMLSSVSEHCFSRHEGESLNNRLMILMGNEADQFMREHYAERYCGHVVVRRARKDGDEYAYRYIVPREGS